MQPHSQPHHSFLSGLQAARQLLLSLKEKKLAQLPPSPPHPPSPAPIPDAASPPPEDDRSQKELAFPGGEREVSVRASLGAKVNEVGGELYEVHLEAESYQLIFQRLCDHYEGSLGTVQENERLKRNSYHLQEEVANYKAKIQQNYALIQHHNANTAQMHALAAHELHHYLSAERERAEALPLPPLQPTSARLPPQERAAEEEGGCLNLKWKAMLGSVRKGGAKRKAKASEDEVRGSFYNSQIYNI